MNFNLFVAFVHISRFTFKIYLPQIHYFVMTGGRGTQLYGVCLTIHEPFSVKIRSGGSSDDPSSESEESPKTVEMFVPKCICILSAYPYLVAFREYLTQLDRLIRKGDMNVPIERYITNFCSEVPAPPPGSFQVQTTILDSVIKIWSPPHNQPIPYVSLPFSHLFECLDIPNIIYAWHALALERQILVVSTQLTLLTTCCEVLKSLLFPMSWQNAYIPLLPRFLCPILSAPMAFLIGIDKQFLSDAFQHLSPECIVIDLDTNQVQFGPNTPPMPKLPPAMAQSLTIQLHQNAGMIFREVRSLRKDDDFSDRGQHLLPHVKQMADACWESKLCLYDEAFHLAFTPEQSRNSDFLNGNDNSGNGNSAQYIHRIHLAKNKKQSRWDAVQEAFLNVYVGLLCNYRSCLVFPSKEAQEQSNLDGGSSRGSSSGSVGHGAGFKSREFLKSQKHERRLFLNELIQTQMFDFFITKRLYGVSASDISFFDRAVDMYNKRQATVMGKIFTMDRSLHPSNTMTSPSGKVATNGGALHDGTHRPVSAPNTVRNLIGRGVEYVAGGATPVDELLLQSAKVHRKLKTIVPPEPYADGLGNGEENPEDSIGYSYESFPSTFDKKLFSTPRPLPPAVLAEFDRQQDNLSSFRRSLKKHLDGQGKDESSDKSLSPEATTFTVFLVGFTAMIGKELIDLSQNEHMCEDERQILATYTVDSVDTEMEKSLASIEDGDGIDVDTFHVERGRFKEPLSASKIEEAKETALAQLNLAFEILDLMKERDLRTDPIAYKSMIDACGRCGDTERATELLTRMHEDGIVADGVVYSCLVSAFSVESKLANINLNNFDLPEWANGASAELDWNRLEGQSGSRYNNSSNNDEEDAAAVPPGTKARKIGKNISKFIKRRIKTEETKEEKKVNAAEMLGDAPIEERYVTEAIANQIGFGENLLELVYPGEL
jgi:pentatricopeptide repeat protein